MATNLTASNINGSPGNSTIGQFERCVRKLFCRHLHELEAR